MKRNGVVVSKRVLNKMINEARLNELNYREKEHVKNFRKILKNLADSDKELSLFCENYGINTDDDNYLILASYLYSVAVSSDPKTVYLLSKKLDDNFVKTCSSNIVDSLQHKAWFDQSNKILTNLAFGNKFVACNLWKLLTNKNYKPIQGTQMPGQIKDVHSFNGTMYVGGNKIENECRYTPWSLLWILAEKQQTTLNEAAKNGVKAQTKNAKNKTKQNNGNTSKGLKLLNDLQIKEINNIIQKLKNINDKVFKMTRSKKADDNDWEKLDEEVKKILDVAFQKYIPYLGQAAKSIFVYPPQLSYDDKNDYEALDQEGRKWDSGKIQNENDLEDAINKMAEEYGLGSKTGVGKFDWAKWLTGLGSSIGGALRR